MSTMRVPANTPLVNIPQDRGGGRRYGLDLGMVPQHEAGSMAAFGGAAAAGYDVMGSGLDDTGRLLMGVSVDLQRREDETRALEAYNQLNERVGLFLNGDGSPDNGLYNRKGATVVGSVKDTREFFDKTVTELAAGLSPNAAKVFSARADVLRFGEQRKVTMFESDGRREWEFDTLKASAEGEMRATLDNFSTPRLRTESMARGTEHIRNMGMMNGMPPEAIENMLRNYQAEIMTAGASQLMSKGDFGGAMTAAMDPSLDESQRLSLVQKAAEGSFNSKLAQYELTGDIPGLRQAGAIAADYTPEGFSEFQECLDPEIRGMAEQEALAQNTPPELVLAVMKCESGGNPAAQSGAGAIGLMQLMPGTAKDLGVDPYDPVQNIRGGVTYLKQMLDRYNGDTQLALMAYNWGPGNVDAWLKTGKGKGGQPMPQETVDYVARNTGLLGARGDAELMPAAPPPSIQPDALATYGTMDVSSQLQADINMMDPADRVKALDKIMEITSAKTAEQLDGLVAGEKLTETQALEQINAIGNLRLRKQTMKEYEAQSRSRRALEKARNDEYQNDFLGQAMGVFSNNDMGGYWKLVKDLPEKTKEQKSFKRTQEGVYAKTLEAADPRYKGKSKGADPEVWGRVYDKILYGELTDQKALIADEDIAKLPMQDMQFFMGALSKSQQVEMKTMKEGFLRALGEEQGNPAKTTLTEEEKARFGQFVPFAQQMAKQTNRGQDMEYMAGLARMFGAKGENNHEGLHLWGYGDNATLKENFEDDGDTSKWLPHFDSMGVDENEALTAFATQPASVRQKYLNQHDADDPENQEEWAARAWVRDQALGPRQRPVQAGLKARDIMPEADYKELKTMLDENPELVDAYMDTHKDKSFDAMMLWVFTRKRELAEAQHGS